MITNLFTDLTTLFNGVLTRLDQLEKEQGDLFGNVSKLRMTEDSHHKTVRQDMAQLSAAIQAHQASLVHLGERIAKLEQGTKASDDPVDFTTVPENRALLHTAINAYLRTHARNLGNPVIATGILDTIEEILKRP